MNTTESLDPTLFQNILGDNPPSLIPESLITTITVGFIVLNVLGLLFLIAYVFSLIRKWKVQSAVLHMQKDLADIKAQLNGQSFNTTERPIDIPPVQNRTVALADRDNSSGDLT